MFSPATLSNVQKDGQRFRSGDPFPHVCIDDFLDPEFTAQLVKEFPQRTDPDYIQFCVEDGGKIGSNYANADVETFPESFKQLDRFFGSEKFIRYLSDLTGISGLSYDPIYSGGGIRESRRKGFLPVHLDFNKHPSTSLHRRLNLLFYLNEDWQEAWGGAIQVHKDPREDGENSLAGEFAPFFNRCFLFETSEHSWHGFSQLQCPDERGRRCFSIYYYTPDRPEGDVPYRNTEYVEPALPPQFAAGHTLSQGDVNLLKELLVRRDSRIAMLYELRRDFDGKYAHLWKEYEYYLAKFKENEEKSDTPSKEKPALFSFFKR